MVSKIFDLTKLKIFFLVRFDTRRSKLCPFTRANNKSKCKGKGKGKVIPLQARCGPEGG